MRQLLPAAKLPYRANHASKWMFQEHCHHQLPPNNRYQSQASQESSNVASPQVTANLDSCLNLVLQPTSGTFAKLLPDGNVNRQTPRNQGPQASAVAPLLMDQPQPCPSQRQHRFQFYERGQRHFVRCVLHHQPIATDRIVFSLSAMTLVCNIDTAVEIQIDMGFS